MNAGFSNLDTLKKHLLASSLTGDDQFDTVIQLIGLGVAAKIENHCARKFMRAVGCQETLPADRINFILTRYPLESMTQVELKLNEASGFVVQDASFVQSVDLENGIVILPDENGDPGQYYSQVRFTYTGGYFWEQTEPEGEGDYPTALPYGANLLPPDLRQAWLLQCQLIWAARDNLGLGLTKKPEEQTNISELKLSPLVADMLGSFKRHTMI